jgi:hypothetical protein
VFKSSLGMTISRQAYRNIYVAVMNRYRNVHRVEEEVKLTLMYSFHSDLHSTVKMKRVPRLSNSGFQT